MTAITTVRFGHSSRESGIRRGEHFAVTRTDSGKGNRDKGGHNCWAQFAREIGDGSSEFRWIRRWASAFS